jgi:small GTP-binding protein
MKTATMNSFKIVVVGSSGTGKSAIVQRLVDDTFREEGQFLIPVESQTVKLQIWDTAGQERFKSVSRAYFRNAVGAVLVYDITCEASFEELANWLHDLQQLCNPNAYIICIGNKSDLADQRQVGMQQAKDFADKHRLEYLETSALSGENVTDAFTRLAFGIASRVNIGVIAAGGPTSKVNPFKDSPSTERAGSGCC